MNNINFIHILHAKKAVEQLTNMLDDKHNENNFILGTSMDDIIRMMRKSNAQSFLLKIKEHLSYQSSTDKTFVKNPSRFTKNDYIGFEDSFGIYMSVKNCSTVENNLEIIFNEIKFYLDSSMDENSSFSCF